MKDIELLKEKIEELESYNDELIRDNNQFRNELDSQEVLSEEWIYEHTWDNDHIWRPFVYVDDLQNLLVPKQVLPTIPKFIAEVIEEDKESGCDVYDSIYFIIETNGGGLPSISDWVAKNIDKYARAWLFGYTVEEQKYYVSARDEEYGGFWFLSKNNNGDISIGVGRDCSEVDWDRLKLTEKEIKSYDPRYWAFAVKVEEEEAH